MEWGLSATPSTQRSQILALSRYKVQPTCGSGSSLSVFPGHLGSSPSSSIFYAKSKLGPLLIASLITSKDKNLPDWFSKHDFQVQVQVQFQTTLQAVPHALWFPQPDKSLKSCTRYDAHLSTPIHSQKLLSLSPSSRLLPSLQPLPPAQLYILCIQFYILE